MSPHDPTERLPNEKQTHWSRVSHQSHRGDSHVIRRFGLHELINSVDHGGNQVAM